MGGYDDSRRGGGKGRERGVDDRSHSRGKGGRHGGDDRRRDSDRDDRNDHSDRSNGRSDFNDSRHGDRNSERGDRYADRNGHSERHGSDRTDRHSGNRFDRDDRREHNGNERNGHSDRNGHGDRNSERGDRYADRNGHSERHGSDRSERHSGNRFDRDDRREHNDDHSERNGHSDRNNRPERGDRERNDRNDRSERSERGDRNGFGDRGRSERGGRDGGRDRSRGPSERTRDEGRGRRPEREHSDGGGEWHSAENDDPSYVHHMDCDRERQRLKKTMNYKRPKQPKLSVDPPSLMKHEVADFRDMNLPNYLLDGIEATGYKSPTPIQSISIPLGIQGSDLLTVAQTGSGKTLCFLITMGHRISEDGKDGDCDMKNGILNPAGIVITPTRELALQIMAHATMVLDSTYLRICGAYGGVKQGCQFAELEKQCRHRKLPNGADIVVGCPGRMSDLSSSGRLMLREISFLVLDEADRLLDMGFQREMDSIVLDSGMPKERQTLFYSATFDRREVEFASGYLKRDYVLVQQGVDRTFPEEMDVNIVKVDGSGQLVGFDEVRDIQRKCSGQVLVFVPTKFIATSWGQKCGKDACVLHGDMSQQARENSLESFRDGRKKMLIATDVAQRGLDVPDVTDVVSLFCPCNEDDLLHRAGRTARSGRRGNFHLLLDGRPTAALPSIINLMKENGVDVPPWASKLVTMCPRGGARTRSRSRSRSVGGKGRSGSRGPTQRGSRY